MTGRNSLDIVVIADPLETLMPVHDTSVALMEAAQERGHRIFSTTVEKLRISGARTVARCLPVTLTPAQLKGSKWTAEKDWWTAETPLDIYLEDVDIVFMRTDPPVDTDYLRATYLLDQVDTRSTVLVNAPAGLRGANEKLFTLRFPHLIPDTLVSADLEELRAVVAMWRQAVLKPTNAMGGRGIVLLRSDDPNLCSLLESSTMRGRTHVIVQRYIEEASEGDRRIIVAEGEPIGVIRRVASARDFRCNMAAGATVVADAVTEEDRQVCQELAPALDEMGIFLAGIDVIGGKLTEVNVTSPTGVREIDALTGSRLADQILERIERRCRLTSHGPRRLDSLTS